MDGGEGRLTFRKRMTDVSAVQLIVHPDANDEYQMYLLSEGEYIWRTNKRKNALMSIGLANLPKICARIVAADVETDPSMRAQKSQTIQSVVCGQFQPC